MNQIGIMLFLAVLPVILILLFVYNKDKTKEPIWLLMKLFGLGICSCFLVVIISDYMEKFLPFMQGSLANKSFVEILLYSFVGVALVEEFCKWIMLYTNGYKSKEFDEIYDILVYAVFVSLGFAFFENILYVVEKENMAVTILRAISAVPSHACDAVFMGYYLNIAKICATRGRKDLEKRNIILSIVVPTILHGIYDFCLMSGNKVFVVVFVIFVIQLYKTSIKKIEELSLNNKRFVYKNNFCRFCGAKVNDKFCPNCGMEQ